MSGTVDPGDYRRIIGLFATGVTVVVTEVDGEPQCMTANAISSVSLNPLLVLVCVNNEFPMAEYLQPDTRYSINILRAEQESLSNYFADMWEAEAPPPYEFVPWEGGLRLEGCIGALGCVAHNLFDGGDHRIVVGRVTALHAGAAPFSPLLFFGG